VLAAQTKLQVDELTARAETAEADLSELRAELVEKTIAKAQLFEKANGLEQASNHMLISIWMNSLFAHCQSGPGSTHHSPVAERRGRQPLPWMQVRVWLLSTQASLSPMWQGAILLIWIQSQGLMLCRRLFVVIALPTLCQQRHLLLRSVLASPVLFSSNSGKRNSQSQPCVGLLTLAITVQSVFT
jgi:hypothetical protein